MARIARTEIGENFVADGAGAAADFVDGQIAADERDAVAAGDLALGHIGDVDRDEIHRNVAGERAGAPADHRHAGENGFAAVAARARRAGIAVRVADRKGRHAPPVGGDPAGIVADGVMRLDPAQLHDAPFEADDRFHRIVCMRRRVAAIERVARPHEVEMRLDR